VIDSGYRGSIQVTFKKNRGVASRKYELGDRIAQIIIVPFPFVTMIETDSLSETSRGEGGHGSTGI
jgi:dUTP pyrophosphatase